MGTSKFKIIEIEETGEFKIPKSVVAQLPFTPKGRFLILQGKDFLTFKKVDDSLPRERFEQAASSVQKKVKALKVSKKVIEEAIQWARKK